MSIDVIVIASEPVVAAPPSTTVNSTCMPRVKWGGPSVPVGALPAGAEPAAANLLHGLLGRALGDEAQADVVAGGEVDDRAADGAGRGEPAAGSRQLRPELVLGQRHQLVERLGRALVAAQQGDLVVLVGLVVEKDDRDPGRDLVAVGDPTVGVVGRHDVERVEPAVVGDPLQQLAVGFEERRRRRAVGGGVGQHVGQRSGELLGHDSLCRLDRRTDGRRILSVERGLEGHVGGAVVAASAAAGRGARPAIAAGISPAHEAPTASAVINFLRYMFVLPCVMNVVSAAARHTRECIRHPIASRP